MLSTLDSAAVSFLKKILAWRCCHTAVSVEQQPVWCLAGRHTKIGTLGREAHAMYKQALYSGSRVAQSGSGRPVNHVVRFYRNHIFTVDDGPPRTMDDPANLDFINSVSKGECPQELDPGNSSAEVTVNMLRVEEDHELPK